MIDYVIRFFYKTASQNVTIAGVMLLSIIYAGCVCDGTDGQPDTNEVEDWGLNHRLLVIYNLNGPDTDGNGIPDSKDIALYYQQKRNIPEKNMLGVNAKTEMAYLVGEWARFVEDLVIPISNKLKQFEDSTIFYLLLCGPIPYIIELPDSGEPSMNYQRSVDNILPVLHHLTNKDEIVMPVFWYQNPYFEGTPTRFDDKEHFNSGFNLWDERIYLVSRLENKDLQKTINLIDMALYGEKYLCLSDGYYNGFFYIDNKYGEYNDSIMQIYPYTFSLLTEKVELDISLRKMHEFAEKAGIAYKNETSPSEIGEDGLVFTDGTAADTAPRAIIYGGWYNVGKYNDVFDWLPGSVAIDVNSNSCDSIKDGNSTFLPSAFSHGLTAGAGVVSEPYIMGHVRPDIFSYYFLTKGFNFIESAWLAEPCMFWQGIYIGDPLYQPYRKGKDTIVDNELVKPRIEIIETDKNEIAIKLDFDLNPEKPELAKVKVQYGENSRMENSIAISDLFYAHHNIIVPDIKKDKSYFFSIYMIDPSGNEMTLEINYPEH